MSEQRREVGAFEVTGLEVRHADRVAVRSLDLTLTGGTVVAVTGSSGSGKSSLLWALAGGAPPTTGSVRLDGTDVTDRARASRNGIALVPGTGTLVSTLTAAENVVVPLLAHRVDAAEASARAQAALATVGLAAEANHLPEELSGGQQQRVGIAVALALRARVLLLDEPTSELDAANRQRVLTALRDEAAAGALVIVATHDPEAAEYADAELGLDDGRARWVRRPPEPPAEVSGLGGSPA